MTEKLVATAELLLYYVLLPIFCIYSLWLAIITSNILPIFFGAVFLSLSIVVVLRKVPYDSKILNTIKIEEAPIYLTRLLSETTNRGILINQLIIKTLYDKTGLSQTDLYHELPVQAQLCPTKEMVRLYIKKLEEAEIIKDIAREYGEAKKKIYVLTKKGEWCFEAIKKYYPTYYVSYLIRDLLKTRLRRKLHPFENINNKVLD